MQDMQQSKEPVFREILEADLMTMNFMGFAYNLSMAGLNLSDPSTLWERMQWDPWLSTTIYRDIEVKDDVIGSQLETRKDSVLSKTRRVLPASDKRQDKKAAEFMEETLEGYFDASSGERTGLDQTLFEMLDAILKGVSIGEIIWQAASDRIYAKQVQFHPQHLFSFGTGPLAAFSTPSYLSLQRGPLRLRNAFGIPGVKEDGLLPENKFIVSSFRPRYGNRWGSPLGLMLFWPAWFKRMGMKQLLRFIEKGTGTVVSRYKPGAGKSEKEVALAAAMAVAEEVASAAPEGYPLEVLQHVRAGMGNSHSLLVDTLCNNAMMRIISGQTLTGRGGEGNGGWSKGDVHQRVRSEKTEADAKFLMFNFNTQVVWPLTLFNIGPVKRPPIWTIAYEPEIDLSAMSNVLARLWTMRLPISKSFVYNTFQYPEPTDENDVLEPPAAGEKPSIPESGVDSSADFAEKKTPKSGLTLKRQSPLRTQRFKRLRPSMTESLKE